MTTENSELFVRLRSQRSQVVQGFLWILMAGVLITFVVNAAMLGREVLTPAVLAPNLVLIGLMAAGLVLNHRHHFRYAVWLVIGVGLFGSVLAIGLGGIEGNEISLFLFFVPLVLAGLLLDRHALYITAGISLAVVMLTPLLYRSEMAMVDAAGNATPWSAAIRFAIVYLTVAFFLDRFGLVFHSTLRTAMRHEIALNQEAQERLRTREALLEGQRLNDAIVENLPGIFFMLDEEGNFHRVNRNVDGLGYSPAELERLGPRQLVRSEDVERMEREIAEVFDRGYVATEAALVAKDGRTVPYFLRATRVSLQGKAYVAGIGIDRSEIDAAQAHVQLLNLELEERLERITALREIDRAITGTMDLDRTLDVVLQQVMQRLQVDAASILLYRAGSRSLHYGAGRGFKGPGLRRTDLRLGEGLAGRAALQREPVIVNGRDQFLAAFAGAASLQGETFRSYIALPLVSKGHLQGVLELFHCAFLDPDDDWSDFLTALATQAALAIDNSRMFENLERSNRELRLAYETTIEGWARALDLKDEETEGHSRRVTDLTVRLARRMGIGENELVHVRRGALLHDIGKMGIPDHVLRKPAPLTDDEWMLMKQHTTFAHDFLAPIPFLRPALEITYCHHEKWDGSGYPLGLEEEQIPLAARLFAVVDVFDALTNDRPYRQAWSKERALDHIREEAGRHFDPAVVGEFMELMRGPTERQTVARPGAGTAR